MGSCCCSEDHDSDVSKPLNNGRQSPKPQSNSNGQSSRSMSSKSGQSPVDGSFANNSSLRRQSPKQPTGSAAARLQDYQKVAYLGQGSFAEVTLARRIVTNEYRAMKKIRKRLVFERGELDHIATERRLLGQLQHPFLVKLHEAFQSEYNLYLVLSYAAGGDFHGLLSRQKRQSLEAVFFYAFEMCLALKYLHDSEFLYRDLKPENVLIDESGHILLTDFGVAKKMSAERTATFAGTLLYCAPEVLKGEPHTDAIDWWGVGVMLFEMVAGRHPYNTGSDMSTIRLIVEHDVEIQAGDFPGFDEVESAAPTPSTSPPPEDGPPSIRSQSSGKETPPPSEALDPETKELKIAAMRNLKDLILALLNRDPDARLGKTMIFDHPFFHADYFQKVYPVLQGQKTSSWVKIVQSKKLTPPFVPQLSGPTDVHYFSQGQPIPSRKQRSASNATNPRSASTSIVSQSSALAPYFDFDDDRPFVTANESLSSRAPESAYTPSFAGVTEGNSSVSPQPGSLGPQHRMADVTGDDGDLLPYGSISRKVSSLSYTEEESKEGNQPGSFSPANGDDSMNRYLVGYTFDERRGGGLGASVMH